MGIGFTQWVTSNQGCRGCHICSHLAGRSLVRPLKRVKTNLTFSWHSGFEGHKFLHLLAHFGQKKVENVLPRPGFEPAINRFEVQCANHYTIATSYYKAQYHKGL